MLKILYILIVAVLPLAAAQSAAAGDTADAGIPEVSGADDLAAVKNRGSIRMLCVPNQENPFIRTNLQKGPMQRIGGPDAFEGIDVELMTAIAEQLGVGLEIVPAVDADGIPSYPQLIPDLLAGKGDLIAGSFSVTPERRRQILFSKPYWQGQVVVVTKKDRNISKLEDLAGLTVALLPDSSHAEYIRDLPEVQILEVSMGIEGYQAVSEGLADFLLDDFQPQGMSSLEITKNLHIALLLPQQDSYALGMRPESSLQEPVNRALKKLRESGRLQRILAPF